MNTSAARPGALRFGPCFLGLALALTLGAASLPGLLLPAAAQSASGGMTADLLVTMALQDPAATPRPFNATIHGQAGPMALYVDGPKVRVQSGKTAQVERRDLGRLWLFDLEKKTFLDLPLNQETLPPPALLRQEAALSAQGEETIDGHPVVKYHVRMPARFFEPQLLSPVDEAHMVEMTVWHSPELGVLLRREGPGNATMTLEAITTGAQPVELFQIPDGYRRAALPISFAK